MVRISDARMSGTAYGTVVLHTAPEAAAGGPLALVRNGDMIELDVEKRRLHLEVSEAELAAPPARLLQALRRSRNAGEQGRGSRFPRRQERRGRSERQSLAPYARGRVHPLLLRPVRQRLQAGADARARGADWQPRFVDFFNGETRTPAYRGPST
jgi:hypothetical protein